MAQYLGGFQKTLSQKYSGIFYPGRDSRTQWWAGTGGKALPGIWGGPPLGAFSHDVVGLHLTGLQVRPWWLHAVLWEGPEMDVLELSLGLGSHPTPISNEHDACGSVSSLAR